VNRRQLDVVADIPRELAALEPRVRDGVSAGVSRGRVQVSLICRRAGSGGQKRTDQESER
jgi:uncharacterized protein YicC (UPF0701 family)